jgi:hypothetical protein
MVGRTQTRRTASERNPPDDCSPQGQPWPEHSSWQTLQECCDLYFFGVTRRVLAACRDAVLKLETAADIELQGLKPSGTRCKVLPQRAEMRTCSALLASHSTARCLRGGLAPLRACHALRQAHCAETHLDGWFGCPLQHAGVSSPGSTSCMPHVEGSSNASRPSGMRSTYELDMFGKSAPLHCW